MSEPSVHALAAVTPLEGGQNLHLRGATWCSLVAPSAVPFESSMLDLRRKLRQSQFDCRIVQLCGASSDRGAVVGRTHACMRMRPWPWLYPSGALACAVAV